MAKDKFKLQKVLDFREIKEQQLQVEVAEMKSSLEKEKMTLNKKRHNLEKYKNMLEKIQKKPSAARDYITYMEYIDHLIKDIKSQAEVIQGIHSSLVSSTEKLKNACQEKQILENLKDREVKINKAEDNKNEQKELDEIGLNINGKSNNKEW